MLIIGFPKSCCSFSMKDGDLMILSIHMVYCLIGEPASKYSFYRKSLHCLFVFGFIILRRLYYYLVNLHFIVWMSYNDFLLCDIRWHNNYICADDQYGGFYDSWSPILITSSLAFPHIDLVTLHVHMLLYVLRRQLFLSLCKTLHHRSRFAMTFPI